MKHATLKLVSLLSITLILAFAAILTVFHSMMNSHIEANANQAIDYLADQLNNPYLFYEDAGKYYAEETEGDDESSSVASCLLVDSKYNPQPYELTKRRELADWCGANPDVGGGIKSVGLGNHEYFVTQVKNVTDYEDGQGIWLVYVDVTAEKSLILRIDKYMLLIMAFCAALASFFGIRIGVSAERGQERQKKFFENASHELKTPLMSIQGYADGIYTGVIPDQKHAASVIMSETDKMAALVDEILCLSRIESGESKLRLENVSVRDVVNNCLVSLESVILRKKLQVDTHLSDVTIQADPARFETAVINLLANAVKYAGSRIAISCDDKSLSVWNDGGRLSRNDAAHLFDRFYTGKNGSTGIGLALTKEIIERHGWRIILENGDDGPLFIIRFSRF
jgi:hypothetical protein